MYNGVKLFFKGGFFSESATSLSNLPISPKTISQKTILNMKFKIPAHDSIMLWAGVLNFNSRYFFGTFRNIPIFIQRFIKRCVWNETKNSFFCYLMYKKILLNRHSIYAASDKKKQYFNSRVSNIESDNSQNVGLEDYNNISDRIFPHFTTPSIKICLG